MDTNNHNEWNNYTAIGYLKYTLNHYNEVASKSDEGLRALTDDEKRKLVACMKYAFDMCTLKQAYDMG